MDILIKSIDPKDAIRFRKLAKRKKMYQAGIIKFLLDFYEENEK